MLPIVHGLEKEYGDRITFVRVNVLQKENAPILDEYGFNATPEFYLVNQQGQIIGLWTDNFTAEELRAALDAALASQ